MAGFDALRTAYDAVVVGARCAGAATAMLLARQGLSVLLVERGRHGTDTLSTHALMRAGVLQLHRWGLLDAVKAAGTPSIRSATFHYADDVEPVEIRPRGALDGLYAPRRTVLDPLLVESAHRSGADVAFGTRLMDLMRTADGRVRGAVIEGRDRGVARIEAGIVIGADGTHSRVAERVGATPYRLGRHATGVVYGYWSGLRIDGYHWYYRPGVSAGAIPTNDGLTCVFAAVPAGRFLDEIRFDLAAGYHRVLAETEPGLAAAVAGARQVGTFRGFPGQIGYMRRSWGPGWALVGDAGYFKDPLTAHGISDALRDAEILARAVALGSEQALAEYQATRDELSSGLFGVTDEIASFQWNLPAVREHHRALSEEMKREVAWLARIDEVPEPSDAGSPADAIPHPAPVSHPRAAMVTP